MIGTGSPAVPRRKLSPARWLPKQSVASASPQSVPIARASEANRSTRSVSPATNALCTRVIAFMRFKSWSSCSASGKVILSATLHLVEINAGVGKLGRDARHIAEVQSL